jgi:hypothetical protein
MAKRYKVKEVSTGIVKDSDEFAENVLAHFLDSGKWIKQSAAEEHKEKQQAAQKHAART